MASKASDVATITLGRIETRLHEIFDGLIDLGDLGNKDDAHLKPFFLTRSLAALALMGEVPLDAATAAKCVTDGGADDGVDAIYVDTARDIVYLVQSKWRSPNKGVELADFTKLRDGTQSLLKLSWTADNANLHRFRPELEAALSNIDTRVVMMIAHTSEQELAENISTRIKKFLNEQNSIDSDFIEFREFRLKDAAVVARSQSRPENISVDAMLWQWGKINEPYEALYGSIAADDLVQWHLSYSNRLFAENLRYTIDKSSINDGIIQTAEMDPQNFWYYNNGVTAICDSIHKKPMGGDSNATGVFTIKRISVINGAQTIGSLARAKANGADLSRARVHIRVISLTNTPEGFATNVTNANNTQNDLNAVDFVAADPTQDRIRKEAAGIGLTYTFRRGDAEPAPATGFDIRSATIAAAGACGDLKVAVASKRYISGLWENTKKEPYTKLFNDHTSAQQLWYAVRVMREVDNRLQTLAGGLAGRDKLVAVHGNRFILHYVFERLRKQGRLDKGDFNADVGQITPTVDAALNELTPLVNKLFPDAYPGNVFKNNDRQQQLLNGISKP